MSPPPGVSISKTAAQTLYWTDGVTKLLPEEGNERHAEIEVMLLLARANLRVGQKVVIRKRRKALAARKPQSSTPLPAGQPTVWLADEAVGGRDA